MQGIRNIKQHFSPKASRSTSLDVSRYPKPPVSSANVPAQRLTTQVSDEAIRAHHQARQRPQARMQTRPVHPLQQLAANVPHNAPEVSKAQQGSFESEPYFDPASSEHDNSSGAMGDISASHSLAKLESDPAFFNVGTSQDEINRSLKFASNETDSQRFCEPEFDCGSIADTAETINSKVLDPFEQDIPQAVSDRMTMMLSKASGVARQQMINKIADAAFRGDIRTIQSTLNHEPAKVADRSKILDKALDVFVRRLMVLKSSQNALFKPWFTKRTQDHSMMKAYNGCNELIYLGGKAPDLLALHLSSREPQSNTKVGSSSDFLNFSSFSQVDSSR